MYASLMTRSHHLADTSCSVIEDQHVQGIGCQTLISPCVVLLFLLQQSANVSSKRKTVDPAEAEALARREAARKRVEARTKAEFGLT